MKKKMSFFVYLSVEMDRYLICKKKSDELNCQHRTNRKLTHDDECGHNKIIKKKRTP